jgi:hypothetical protein
MNWIGIAKAVFSLLPVIIDAIKALEAAIPAEKMGAEKLNVIRGIIESIDAGASAVWPYLEKAVNIVVAVFNKLGVFKTTTT